MTFGGMCAGRDEARVFIRGSSRAAIVVMSWCESSRAGVSSFSFSRGAN